MSHFTKPALAVALITIMAAPAAFADKAKAESAPADKAPVAFASKDVLSREPVTETADVQHILIGWADLAAAYGGRIDPRAVKRDKANADDVVADLLLRARAGESFTALMKDHSEDPGSAADGRAYTATPEAGLVPEFKALSLRLNVDEIGLVETRYGWHIIKRTK